MTAPACCSNTLAKHHLGVLVWKINLPACRAPTELILWGASRIGDWSVSVLPLLRCNRLGAGNRCGEFLPSIRAFAGFASHPYARLTGDIDGRFKNQQPQLSYQRIRGTFGGLICVLACHPERRGIQIRPSYSWKLTSAPEIHARHSSDGLVMHPDDNQDNRENRLSHTLNGTVFYRPLPQESP